MKRNGVLVHAKLPQDRGIGLLDPHHNDADYRPLSAKHRGMVRALESDMPMTLYRCLRCGGGQ